MNENLSLEDPLPLLQLDHAVWALGRTTDPRNPGDGTRKGQGAPTLGGMKPGPMMGPVSIYTENK